MFRNLKNRFASLFVHKEGEEVEERKALSKSWRSRHYRSHFEGYSEVMEPRESGRGFKTHRVYIGDYYVAHTDDRLWRLYKGFYTLLVLLSALFWSLRIMARYPVNAVWYGAIPQVACACAYLLMVRFLIERYFAPRKMVIREYRQAVRNLRGCALALIGLTLFSALIVAVHALVTGTYVELQETLFDVLAAACAAVLYALERQIVYDVVENEAKNEVDGFEVP